MSTKKQFEKPFVSIGVPVDIKDLQFDDLMRSISGLVSRKSDVEWELGAYLAAGYLRNDWRLGLNTRRPTYKQYLRYLQTEVLSGYVDRTSDAEPLMGENRKLVVNMEVYVGYAHYNDQGVVDDIKRMGMSKPHIALAYLSPDDDIERVREVIALCKNNPAARLRDVLEKRFRTTPDQGDDGDTTNLGGGAKVTLRHLGWSPTPMIGGTMFVPRSKPVDLATEMAWFCVFDAVRKSRLVMNEETGKPEPMSTDDLFAEIMTDWVNRRVKPAMMNKAREFFEIRMGDLNKGITPFPFDEREAA